VNDRWPAGMVMVLSEDHQVRDVIAREPGAFHPDHLNFVDHGFVPFRVAWLSRCSVVASWAAWTPANHPEPGG